MPRGRRAPGFCEREPYFQSPLQQPPSSLSCASCVQVSDGLISGAIRRESLSQLGGIRGVDHEGGALTYGIRIIRASASSIYVCCCTNVATLRLSSQAHARDDLRLSRWEPSISQSKNHKHCTSHWTAWVATLNSNELRIHVAEVGRCVFPYCSCNHVPVGMLCFLKNVWQFVREDRLLVGRERPRNSYGQWQRVCSENHTPTRPMCV